MRKATPADFGPAETIKCTQCGEKDATHEISVTARRGFDYQSSKQLFHLTYSVCGDCAKDIVQVKLAADLRAGK